MLLFFCFFVFSFSKLFHISYAALYCNEYLSMTPGTEYNI